MAVFNSTQPTELLGKTVILTHRDHGSDSEHRGQVIAVVSVVPGSRASASIMLEEDSSRCDYFDLDEITIKVIF